MNKISVIVFDLGNVLINFDYNITREKLNSVEKNLGNNFLEYYKNNYEIHRKFESGKLSEDAFLENMLKYLKHKVDKEFFCNAYSDIFTVNQEVVNLLPILKRNYQLVLLSNTDPIHRKYGWEKYDFLKYFDKMILSFEAGSVKPEEKIYKEVEKFTGKQPSEHFYTDDISEYIEGAKNLGWDAVQFTSYKKLKAELVKRKIIAA